MPDADTFFRSLKPDDPIYAAIGRVAAASAHFEFHVREEIWKLANLDPAIGAKFTKKINQISELVAVYTEIASGAGCDEDLIALIEPLVISQVFEKRNRIVHDPWVLGETTGQTGRIEAADSRRITDGFQRHNLEAIDAVGQEIRELDIKFRDIAAQISVPLRESTDLDRAIQKCRPTAQ